MPEHSRDYIMHAAKSAYGTFSRPRAIPTYLPTYLSILSSTAKAIYDATYFPNLLQDRDLTTFSLYFHYALRSRCRKRSFFNIF